MKTDYSLLNLYNNKIGNVSLVSEDKATSLSLMDVKFLYHENKIYFVSETLPAQILRVSVENIKKIEAKLEEVTIFMHTEKVYFFVLRSAKFSRG
ncbi:MAG: hypothetical protein GF311_28180 [Candidatus Lokiarchaeota archaeon]|nr:hypothetical protein [Candidatus Lokiarchaeota archaeon]